METILPCISPHQKSNEINIEIVCDPVIADNSPHRPGVFFWV
jgi:hypothetical protein